MIKTSLLLFQWCSVGTVPRAGDGAPDLSTPHPSPVPRRPRPGPLLCPLSIPTRLGGHQVRVSLYGRFTKAKMKKNEKKKKKEDKITFQEEREDVDFFWV